MSAPNPLNPVKNLVIEASSELAVTKRQNDINQPGIVFKAWTEDDSSKISEGTSGSVNPIVLKIPLKPAKEYIISGLRITGTCTYPPTFPRGPGEYRLVGSTRGVTDRASIISSKSWQETLPPKNPPQDEIMNITAEAFTLPAVYTEQRCLMPFSLAGDFEWKVVNEMTKQEIVGTTLTRLEFLWLLGPSPTGPLSISGPALRTAMDLSGSYPVDLLRLFLPSPSELQEAIKFTGDYRDWWLGLTNTRIHRTKLVYNTISGKSGFGSGCCGGSFAWKRFIHLVPFDGSATLVPCLVNSYDIAALVQLSCCLLVDLDSTELLPTTWVCKTPFGKVLLSVPIGVTSQSIPAAAYPPGVNNPWFSGIDQATPFESDTSKAFPMNARVWLETQLLRDIEKVVDIAWYLPAADKQSMQPELRTRGRIAYGQACIEPPLPTENLASYEDNGLFRSAQCFSNNWVGKQTKGSDTIDRIGVYDTNGIQRPRQGDALPFVPVPYSLRQKIENIIAHARRTGPLSFNDASLKVSDIEPVLSRTTPLKLQADLIDITTTIGATRVSLSFSDMPATTAEKNAWLGVEISIFDDISDSTSALLHELTKYERDISEIAQPVAEIGDCALTTPHSILCIHGNIFIELTIQSFNRPDSAAHTLINGVMKRFDDYLSSKSVTYDKVRRPNLEVVVSPPDVVMDNSKFELKMLHPETLSGFMHSQNDRGYVVVQGNLDASTYTYQFYVLERKDKTLSEPTILTITGAHSETFHPGSNLFRFRVGKLIS